MKYGSLFSGAGLGDFGFELAGLECAWQVEIDDYCQKILELRWPNVRKFRDIKTLDPKDLEEVDLITGGFPCQDISQANTGKIDGIKGKRSGLWSEMFRIICEIRPKYVVVENVSALLFRGIDVVLRDLATIRYDAEWGVLSSCQFGAPHTRERVWIVSYPNSISWSVPKIFTKNSIEIDFWEKDKEKWCKNWFRPVLGTYDLSRLCDEWEVGGGESNFRRVVNGDSTTLDRLKALGNGQTPCSTYVIGKWIMEVERRE